MRVVIQRVKNASVTVEGTISGKIQDGLLVLCGFVEEDTVEDFEWMSKKIIQLRIFNDSQGVMNLSVQDIDGDVLIVSQFTLHAQTKKGNRPSYIVASKPEIAKQQYKEFINIIEKHWNKKVEQGVFGGDMKVELLNDGPVTLIIDSKNKEI